MKLAGALMIALGCVLGCAGLLRSQALRAAELRSLCGLVTMMRRELELSLAPLPQLALSLCGRVGGPAAGFMKALSKAGEQLGDAEFKDIWRECLRASFSELEEDEYASLEALGAVLGRFTLEAQLAALDGCAENLGEKYRAYMGTLADERRMKIGLICAFCALIFIVLV